MAQQTINVGTTANDGTGDSLRNGFIKVNQNFTELYTNLISGSGTDNYIPRFNGTNALENSIIFDNGTNVGIGTTNPLNKFVVSNNNYNGLEFIPDNGSGMSQIFSFNRTLSAWSDFALYSSNLIFNTNGSNERMRITSSGNVGIGTSYPTGKLDLVDYDMGLDGYGNFNIFTNDSASTSKGGSIAFGGNNSTGGTTPYPFAKIQGIKSSEAGSYRGALRFATASSSSELLERMRIDHNGNVGIGTTSPSSVLHVIGKIKATSSIQVGNNSEIASAENVGAIRYSSDSNNSYIDVVMQTGTSSYSWVNIVQNNF